MSKQDIIARGQDAKRVLEMPEFKNTLEEVRLDIFNQFKRTTMLQVEEREAIHGIACALDMFVAKIEKYWSTAEYEMKLNAADPE